MAKQKLFTKKKILGISVPVLAVGGVLAYLFLKKK